MLKNTSPMKKELKKQTRPLKAQNHYALTLAR